LTFGRDFFLVRLSRDGGQVLESQVEELFLHSSPANISSTIMASFNPTQIFDDGTTEEKGENARLSAFVGAIAVGDLGI
jgi:hypothetical protein